MIATSGIDVDQKCEKIPAGTTHGSYEAACSASARSRRGHSIRVIWALEIALAIIGRRRSVVAAAIMGRRRRIVTGAIGAVGVGDAATQRQLRPPGPGRCCRRWRRSPRRCQRRSRCRTVPAVQWSSCWSSRPRRPPASWRGSVWCFGLKRSHEQQDDNDDDDEA
jgi:hypothetical protein